MMIDATHRKKLPLFLFILIFLEGYAVLSAELLAIRLVLPFVDNGTDTVSIIISAVLLPLAFGYYAGGRFTGNRRKKLIHNLLIASAILCFGLSYTVITELYTLIAEKGPFQSPLVQTALYSLIFLAVPVYYLGQTVPLVSYYFSRHTLHEATGKILCFSTIGSFSGAVITTLIFMNWIGVSATASLTILSLSLCLLIIARRKTGMAPILGLLIFSLSAFLNSPFMLSRHNILYENVYNTTHIEVYDDKKYLFLNRALSSGVNSTDEGDVVFPYVSYVEDNFIRRLYQAERKGHILVIGAGGFTIGLTDRWNTYTYVDIDPALKDVTETHFLNRKLNDNVTFIPSPARAYLNTTNEYFDIIIVDVYRGLIDIPEHLLTHEFFTQVQSRLKDDGIILIHQTGTATMDDVYSRTVDNTIRSVFPNANRKVFASFNPWIEENVARHFSVVYDARNPVWKNKGNLLKNHDGIELKIYSDNHNTAIMDRRQ